MASIQDLRRRIRAVRNMQQVTRAMKMVAAARLRRAQSRVIAARPYADKMTEVLTDLTEHVENYTHPLLDERGNDHLVLVLITSDRGFCGSFNSNLIRAAQHVVHQNQDKQIKMVTIGRKGGDFFRRRHTAIRDAYVVVTATQVEFAEAQKIAQKLIDDFADPEQAIDRVLVIFSEFKSAIKQETVVEQLMPISNFRNKEQAAREVFIDYLYEQPPAEIFGNLLPHYVQTQVFRALLETAASEHGARMVAMDAATNNAAEMIENLTLNMNRVRQASITKEIIEIVSGAAALEEAAG